MSGAGDSARGGARAPDGYALRVATPADLDVVLHHRRRMFEDMGFTDPAAMQAMLASSTPLLRDGLASGRYRGWLAEIALPGTAAPRIASPVTAAPGTAAAGSAAREVVAGGGVIVLDFQSHPIDPRPQRAWVVNMFTEPAHRHRGLARRLMQAMIDWCRAERMRVLYLHASDEGRPLYESLGFEPTNEMRLML